MKTSNNRYECNAQLMDPCICETCWRVYEVWTDPSDGMEMDWICSDCWDGAKEAR